MANSQSRRVAERLAADAGLAVPAPEHNHDSNPLFHVWSPAHPALEQYFERVLGEANAQVLAYDELLWNADAPKAGVVAPLSFLESVELHGASSDYEHVELEGREVGTRFTSFSASPSGPTVSSFRPRAFAAAITRSL